MIKRSPIQEQFENCFLGSNGVPFQNIRKQTYENTALDGTTVQIYNNQLTDEITEYYYKSLLSYVEGVKSAGEKCYSWATVKLYYSVFYSLRAFLACNKIAFVRAGTKNSKLLYFKIQSGEKYKSCPGSTDHKGTIEVQKMYFAKQDFLLSQEMIEGGNTMSSYEWLARRREEVNYKDIMFRDPEPFQYWEEIENSIVKDGMGNTVKKMLDDNWSLCFQDEYGILGIPTKRLLLTVQAMKLEGYSLGNTERESFAKSIMTPEYEEIKGLFLDEV